MCATAEEPCALAQLERALPGQHPLTQPLSLPCSYFIRVTVSRRMADIVKEKELWVHSYRMPPDITNSIKMEVGIEDCLHIEFEYNKAKCVAFFSLWLLGTAARALREPAVPEEARSGHSRSFRLCARRYHLKDVIVGKIYFLLVRIKIKHMELSIIRRETTGAGPLALFRLARLRSTSRRPRVLLSSSPRRVLTLSRPSCSAEPVQRERDDHQVRDHGRRARARSVHRPPLSPARLSVS